MKNLKRVFMSLLALLLSINSYSQEKSLLYKIEGNGIKTSYVFGTIHMLPKDDFVLEDKVKKAFESSEQLVMEADINNADSDAQYLAEAMIEENDSLQNYMTTEEYEILDNYFVKKMGAGMSRFNKMKPFVVSSTAMVAHLGENLASYEHTFSAMAKEQGKEVSGLETISFQIGLFKGIPYEDQIDDIIDMLKEDGDIEGYFNKLVTAYKTNDIEHLHNILNEYFQDDAELKERLLFKRNENWLPKIGELSKDKATFYAVGAGHLGSNRGVINLLKEEGYKVTPIIN